MEQSAVKLFRDIVENVIVNGDALHQTLCVFSTSQRSVSSIHHLPLKNWRAHLSDRLCVCGNHEATEVANKHKTAVWLKEGMRGSKPDRK